MLNITCKGGDIRQVAEGTTIDALCRDISMGLYRAACAAKLNGKTVDLRTPLTEDGAVDILTFDDEDGKRPIGIPPPTSWPRPLSGCGRRPS